MSNTDLKTTTKLKDNENAPKTPPWGIHFRDIKSMTKDQHKDMLRTEPRENPQGGGLVTMGRMSSELQ
jgi:hypothetical protein